MTLPHQAISRGFRGYLDFVGRSNRSEYWWWTLFNVVVIVVGYGIVRAVDWIIVQVSPENYFVGLQLLVGLGYAWGLTLLVPCVAMAARRLRDAGLSPLFGLAILTPYIGSLSIVVFGLLPTKTSVIDDSTIVVKN